MYDEGVMQSQNALTNYAEFSKEYAKIEDFYKAVSGYKPTPNYLSRNIHPAINYSDLNVFFLNENTETVYEAIEKNKYIALLSDAGMGKTTELKQIAYYYSQSDFLFHPIYIQLNKYMSGNFITEYFPSYWEFIPKNKLLIILDGMDEIQSKDKLDVTRAIKYFVEKYEDIHVVISCRSNFYNIEIENNIASLNGFKSYLLVELKHEEIQNYVGGKLGSKSSEFFELIYQYNLSNILKVPFYLIILVELFEERNELPKSKSEIFNILLESRIQLDENHYDTTIELKECDKKL